MGLMDSLKKATGLGLTPAQHYARAYEKAVLLGPSMFGEAVGLFDAAAKKAVEAGDFQLQSRSLANARLYGFITTGNTNLLPDLKQALTEVPEIELIGSRTDMMPAPPLVTEIDARIAEVQAESIASTDNAGRAEAHRAIAEKFKTIFDAKLVTYRHKATDQHTELGHSRFFFHQGMAAWHEACGAVGRNPTTAAEQMAKALNSFHQCKDADWSAKSQRWLENCRQQRTCWMCHREFQGNEIHFSFVNADVAPYVDDVLEKLGQDRSSVDVQGGAIALCTPCKSALINQAEMVAEQRVAALRAEVDQAVAELHRTMGDLARRVGNVESYAHRH